MADGVPFVEGVDHTGGANIGALVAAGKQFACRYGGAGGSWKHITPAEAQALSAAGVAIVANAEGSAAGLLGGRSAGIDWARSAEAHFAACGMPAGRPIYLSVDFDVTSGQWPAVREALRGAASVLGAARVGVYGGRRAIEWARRDGCAHWFWQTYAWSGGVWVPGNNLEQYRNGVPLAGVQLDLDRALTADFGQWTTTGDDDMATGDAPNANRHGWALTQMLPTYEVLSGNDTASPVVVPNRMVEALNKLLAAIEAEKTRDASEFAMIQAIAAGGTSIDTTAVIAAGRAEGEKTRLLVAERHQVEMAAVAELHATQLAERDTELARVVAELAALQGAAAS